MSKATKRKHVAREVLDDYVLPEEHQKIVQVRRNVMMTHKWTIIVPIMPVS